MRVHAEIQPLVESCVNHWCIYATANLVENQPMAQQPSPIGYLIKRRLEDLGKNQSWLAAEAGVSDNAVSKWIKSGNMSRESIANISRILGIPVGLFVGAAASDPEKVKRLYGAIPGLSLEESKLIESYRAASPEIKAAVLSVLRIIDQSDFEQSA